MTYYLKLYCLSIHFDCPDFEVDTNRTQIALCERIFRETQ